MPLAGAGQFYAANRQREQEAQLADSGQLSNDERRTLSVGEVATTQEERKKMLYLTNAFALSMLPAGIYQHTIRMDRVGGDRLKEILGRGFVSAIGHADTAAILTGLLGVPVEQNRVNIVLANGDELVVAQYNGPRLQEGIKELPAGSEFTFWLVRQ